MKLSILIPVYNEENTIEKLLDKVWGVKLNAGISKEIIIIDDGSSDKTYLVLSKFHPPASRIKFKILKHKKNQGKGAAIKTGLKYATGDLIIIQDADLEYNPQDYLKLLKPAVKGESKVVYGTRLVTYPLRFWGKKRTIMPVHLIANYFLTALTNILYGSNLTDMETCYKLISRDVLKDIEIESNRFDFEPEITAKILKKGISIMEVPIKVHPRTYKEGKKIGWRDGIIAVWTLIKYKFMH